MSTLGFVMLAIVVFVFGFVLGAYGTVFWMTRGKE